MKIYKIILLLLFLISCQQEPQKKLNIFTSIDKCKACFDPVKNVLALKDSISQYELEIFLDCRRSRDIREFRKRFSVDSTIKITKSTEDTLNYFDVKRIDYYFVAYENNKKIIATDNYIELLNKLK